MIGGAVRDNLAALGQALGLLAGLDAELYTRPVPACFNSTAGAHLRHVIEHYTSFLSGVRGGLVDYEARARDSRIETEPGYALACIERLGVELRELADDGRNRRLRVRSETAGGPDREPDANGTEREEPWADSCVLRELEYLLSHTVHHYALIGVICGLAGHAVPKDFGLAPSTLRFLQAQAKSEAAA